jgi:hypothetical protein
MKYQDGKWMLTKREAENIVRPETQNAAIKALNEAYKDADTIEQIVKTAETMCADAIATEWVRVPTLQTYDGRELFYKA